jgi:hypothetical protein
MTVLKRNQKRIEVKEYQLPRIEDSKVWTVSTVDGQRVAGHYTRKEAHILAKAVSEKTGYFAELRRNGAFVKYLGAVQASLVDKPKKEVFPERV